MVIVWKPIQDGFKSKQIELVENDEWMVNVKEAILKLDLAL